MSIALSIAALARLRIAVSPMWETVGSLALLARGGSPPWPYGHWAREAERVLVHRPGAELVTWARRLPGPVPDFLTPVPSSPDRTLDDELAALRGIEAETLAVWLAQASISEGTTGEDPTAWLHWFTAAVADYWEAAIQPHWGKMRAALREDVLSRAHLLATEGADSLLSRLAGRTRWSNSTLELGGSSAGAEVRCDEGLVVVPLIFGRWMVRYVSNPAGVVAVSCQARGAAVLGEPGVSPRPPVEPVRGDRLALILGRGRAAVLRGLTVPTTTSDLSRSLGLSASTVSQHLSALMAANVVRKRRTGSRVLYTLDRAGVALLTYLDNEMGRPAV